MRNEKSRDGLTLGERLAMFNLLNKERLKDLETLSKIRILGKDELVERAVEKEKLRRFLGVKKVVFESLYTDMRKNQESHAKLEAAIDNADARTPLTEDLVYWAIQNSVKAKKAWELQNSHVELFHRKNFRKGIRHPSDILIHLGTVGFQTYFLAKYYPGKWKLEDLDRLGITFNRKVDTYTRELEHVLDQTYKQGYEGIISHKDHLVIEAIKGLFAHKGFVKEFTPRLFTSPSFNFIRPEVVFVEESDIRRYLDVNKDLFDAVYYKVTEGKDHFLLDQNAFPPNDTGTSAFLNIFEQTQKEILDKVKSLKPREDSYF